MLRFGIRGFQISLGPALAMVLVAGIEPVSVKADTVAATSGTAVVSSSTGGEAEEPPDVYGIGVLYTPDGDNPRVVSIAKGGAAELDGHLKIGDHLAGVAEGNADFVDCKGMDLPNITPLTRGKEGTIVRLKVIPASDPTKIEVIALKRAELYITRLLPAEKVRVTSEAGKIADTQREWMMDDMGAIVGRVVESTGLDKSGSNALEDAATVAVDQCSQRTSGKVTDLLKKYLLKFSGREERAMALDRIDANPLAESKAIESQNNIQPDQEQVWQAALKKVLTSKQAAAWQGVLAEEKQKTQGQRNSYLDQLVRYENEEEMVLITPEVGMVEAEIDLPKEREDQLMALEKSVSADFAAEARAASEKALAAMSESERKTMLGGRGFRFIGKLPEPSTDKWKEALAKLLSADEMRQLAKGWQSHEGLRAAANGKLLVALLDDKLALTVGQRRQLEPIAAQMMEGQSDMVGNLQQNIYFAYMPARFYSVVASGSENEIKAILDPIQWGHWEELRKLKDQEDTSNMMVPQKLPSLNEATAPGPAVEPEAVERAISEYLAGISGSERESVVAERVLKAEDITHVVHLPGDAAERLKVAADGDAERYLLAWNDSAEQIVRSSVDNGSPDTVRQQLENIQTYQFQNVAQQLENSAARQASAWDKTVKAELNPDQMKAWHIETGARSAYREEAVAEFVISTLDREFGLSAKQWAKLQPMVAKVLDVYGRDFESGFGDSVSGWFLNCNYTFLPLAGIPEADMKGLLSSVQWERWRASGARMNSLENWPYVLQAHKQAAGLAKGTP